VLGDYRSYRLLSQETSDRQIIDCLDEHGLRGATADYWIAYRLTFLSGEHLIVAPDTGPRRYEPYEIAVSGAPRRAHVEHAGMTPPPGFFIVCLSPLLQASVAR